MLFTLLALPIAHADTLRVGDGETYDTIRAAIEASVDGDRIEVATGTYPEQLVFSGKAITLISDAGPTETIITGNGSSTLLLDNGEGSDTVISGFTIQGDGHSCAYFAGSSPHLENLTFEQCGSMLSVNGGAIQVSYGSPTLKNVDFRDNRAQIGGAIYLQLDSSVLLEECTFSENQAENAGAIAGYDSIITIRDSRFENNEAIFGAAGALSLNDTTLVMEETDFESNRATYNGGAILMDGGSLEISNVSFLNNESSFGEGGSIRANETTPVLITDSSFVGNQAGHHGGAFAGTQIDTAEFANNTFSSNTAELEGLGGAIYLEYANLTLDGGTASENQSAGGGAIWSLDSDVTLTDTTLENNNAFGAGGAITVKQGEMVISNSTFEGNRALSNGGSLYSSAIESRISNSRFEDNESTGGHGGAIALHGTEALLHKIFAGNNWGRHGGAIYVDAAESLTGSQLFLQNSIIQENESLFGGGALFSNVAVNLFLHNNNLVANRTLTSGTGSQLQINTTESDIRSNIIAWGENGAAIAVGTDAEAGLIFRHNDLYENDEDFRGLTSLPDSDDGNIWADPEFMTLSLDRDFSNDDFYLRPGSPCLGAGDPELVGPAWLAGDIGALGITDVSPIDADGDGYSPDLDDDCDDSDPSVHIDAEEVCDDGIDNNCDSFIDEGCEIDDTGDLSNPDEEDTGEAEEPNNDEPEGTGPDSDDRTENNSAETMASDPGLYVVNGKGCSCSATHSSPVRLWWALFPLILIRRRAQ